MPVPRPRSAMRKTREVLRLTLGEGLSRHQVSAATGMPRSTVINCLSRATAAGLTWPLPEGMDDRALEELLYRRPAAPPASRRPQPDWAEIHTELRHKGVTLQLLWMEHKEREPDGYQYTQFVHHYRRWAARLDVVLRQDHRAGEKLFVDFAGQTLPITDSRTGVQTPAELFVAVLGASNYTYAEATRSQKLEDFVASTVRTFEFLGAVPEVVVPDQLRSAVSGPHRYEPDINPTYLEMAQHYSVTVIPARPRKPRDKAKVEGGVLIVQRWVVAALRNRTFFSLGELNAAIRELIERLNARPFKRLDGCRRSAFEALDRPVMRPLPARRYEVADWKHAKVHVDYCVTYDHRHYSVPYALVGEAVEIRATVSVVEVLHKGVRVACHARHHGPKGAASIVDEHRPRAHREYGKWPPERVVSWAASIGGHVGEVAAAIMGRRTHPETGYRACLGVIRLADRYGRERVDAACARAMSIGSPSFKSVQAILKSGLDRAPLAEPPARDAIDHDNIRGASYFDKEEDSAQRRDDCLTSITNPH